MSTYPHRCVVKLERRTIPGERPEDVTREVEAACERVRARRPSFAADVRTITAQSPSDVSVDAPIVRLLERAIAAHGGVPRIEGLSAWTDCALLNEAGIPAVCFGPGDIAFAHAAEEWVEVAEIEQATSILETAIREWSSAR
jgi:acetylornithine deacetylase